MKQRAGVVRLLGVLQLQEAQVPLQLAMFLGLVLIAGVIDGDIGPAGDAAGALDCGPDLLVDAVLPANLRQVAKELGRVEQRRLAAGFVRGRDATSSR